MNRAWTTAKPKRPARKNRRHKKWTFLGLLHQSKLMYCEELFYIGCYRLLDGSVGFSDSDLSLLSWLQSIPGETFSVPFEQRTLNVDVERLERPSLETSWTEHMLITPIKPKTFPHSAMPFTRPRSAADIMSRSLLPTLEGLPYSGSPGVHNGNPRLMALSTGRFQNWFKSVNFALWGAKLTDWL